MELPKNTIVHGHVLDVLKTWPSESIDMVVTSPPYWGLRAYGTDTQIWDAKEGCQHEWKDHVSMHNWERKQSEFKGIQKETSSEPTGYLHSSFCSKCDAWRGELGLEPTFDLYIKHLCDIFDEIKRVLKPTGSAWINIGDTYSGSGCGTNDYRTEASKSIQGIGKNLNLYKTGGIAQRIKSVPAKSLCMIPARFAIEMINRGWTLRNEIIWYKRNCMPSSSKDRFTVDFEPIFFFTKSRKYYFEQQFEPWTDTNPHDTNRAGKYIKYNGKYKNSKDNKGVVAGDPIQGRNKRTVWDITLKGFPDAHFAVFPPALVETPIKASCPEFVCNKCGKPKEKVYQENGLIIAGHGGQTAKTKIGHDEQGISETSSLRTGLKRQLKEVGYSSCSCNSGFSPGICLDPFMGSGTTALMALKLGRHFVGIELQPSYIKMAMERIRPFLEQKRLSI